MKRIILISVLSLFTAFGLTLSAQSGKPKAHAESELAALEIVVNDNLVQVRNATVGQTLEVFSVVGLKVDEFKIKAINAEYKLNVPKGYYILKVGDIVRKVAVK